MEAIIRFSSGFTSDGAAASVAAGAAFPPAVGAAVVSLSLTLVKVKNGYKPSNYAGCSHSPFRNDLCYFFVSSVLVLFIMLRIVDFEINS